MKNGDFEMDAERKPNRLKCYDYTTAGAYHVSICTFNRRELFIRENKLTIFGKIAEENIGKTADKFEVEIKYHKIMPDHVHMLIENYYIRRDEKEIVNLSDIVSHYKANVFLDCKRIADSRKIVIGKMWQRSFYDHILRGERDYYETIKYITYNDLK